MFSTSGDILNLVLAVCVFLLTSFLCVALYYLISSMKKTHRVIRMIELMVNKADDVINLTKDKIKNSGTYLMLFGELIKKLMDHVVTKPKKQEKEESDDKEEKKKVLRKTKTKTKTSKAKKK